MRALTKDLGRLVYKVETEPLPTSNIRRGGANGGNGGIRRTAQSVPPGSLDQNSSIPQRVRTLSSDDDTDPPEHIIPQQFPPTRTSIIDRNRIPRRRTNSDDSLTHSTATASSSSILNRVIEEENEKFYLIIKICIYILFFSHIFWQVFQVIKQVNNKQLQKVFPSNKIHLYSVQLNHLHLIIIINNNNNH